MLLLLLVVWILFSVILIDNLKISRNFFFFFKINKNLKHYNFIFFCYKKSDSKIINKYIESNKITYYFLKKLKSIKSFFCCRNFLNNSITLYCTNEETLLFTFLQELNSNLIFCKINNNFYSIKDLKNYSNSKIELVEYINNYYYNFIYMFDKLNKK